MKLSQRSLGRNSSYGKTIIKNQSLVRNQSFSKKTIKKPKQLINRLNQQISTIQTSVKEYNENEQKSRRWKKQLNMNQYSCQLKSLTQPKLQNILLESNFINSMSIFNKNMNQSGIKNSTMKSNMMKNRNMSNRNSLYSSSGFGLRKTISVNMNNSPNKYNNQQNIRNSQRSSQRGNQNNHPINKSNINNFIKEQVNPQNSSFKQSSNIKFNSFRQQVNRFDKVALLSKTYKNNYSNKRPTSKSNIQSNQPSKNPYSQSSVFKQSSVFNFNDNDLSTVIDQQSQSILMNNSMRFRQQLGFNNLSKQFSKQLGYSKQLGLLPITQQKFITISNSQRNSNNLRKRIQQKTHQLQKQWLKTQCYRQKFNIMTSDQFQANQQGGSKANSKITTNSKVNKVKRSISKLANIIQKVQQRRPSTSSYQRTTANSRQTTNTIADELIKQKSKTVSRLQIPQFQFPTFNFF